MKTRVQKWGDGLALPIPKDIAATTGLAENSVVEVALVAGKLVVSPARTMPGNLDELLSKITDENIHSEIDTGPAVGGEVW
jgi:antitoxin MazE